MSCRDARQLVLDHMGLPDPKLAWKVGLHCTPPSPYKSRIYVELGGEYELNCLKGHRGLDEKTKKVQHWGPEWVQFVLRMKKRA